MTYAKWICVEEAHGHLEGEIIRSRLEANDIPVQVFQESAGITYGLTVGSLGLVKIWVPEEFESAALNLLQNQGDIFSESEEQ